MGVGGVRGGGWGCTRNGYTRGLQSRGSNEERRRENVGRYGTCTVYPTSHVLKTSGRVTPNFDTTERVVGFWNVYTELGRFVVSPGEGGTSRLVEGPNSILRLRVIPNQEREVERLSHGTRLS